MSTSDDAILPSGLDGDDALQDAVGVKARRRRRRPDEERLEGRFDDGDGGEPPTRTRSRRTMIVASLSIIAGLSTAALVFLGRANAQRYLLVCSSARVTAEQGRGFPPWGSHPMTGPEWKPIALPADAECKPRETEDASELGKWYLDLLIERATITLTARNLLDSVAAAPPGGQQANPLDTAAEQLDQALLLARDPDRRDQRKEIQRLLGDVDYWRASARLRDASAVLLDAAKQFDTAAAQRPRHVSDAAAWATFLRKVADELHNGPNGAPPPVPTAAGSNAPVVPAPAGVALPVEPDKSSAGSAALPPAPDAGVPAGGVLL